MTDKHSGEPASSGPAADLRTHRQRTERNLVLAGFAVLFVIGGGLAWLLYGLGAALVTWGCLGGGVALFGGLYLILKLLEMWVARRG